MSSRKPLNTESEVDIFTATSDYAVSSGKFANSVSAVQKMNQSMKAVASPPTKPTVSKSQPVTKNANMPDQTKRLNRMTNSFNAENSNGLSPTRSNTFGSAPRIVKRELWWKEQPTEFKVPEAKPFKPSNVSSKIDNKMPNYSPPISQRQIVSEKLQWNSQPAINTWENFHHQPKGGNKRYPVEHVEWNALPKIDSGFVYTYEPTNIENNLQ